MRSRRKIELVVIAVFVLCAWFLFDARFSDIQEQYLEAGIAEKPWRYEEKVEEKQNVLGQENANAGTREETSSTSTTSRSTSIPVQSTVPAIPTSSLPDRVVVMAKLPTDDTQWVHIDLQDWQSAIHDIDTEFRTICRH